MEISRFPNKLRSYRRSCGYSLKKVARMLGHADTSTLSRWERGIGYPSIAQVFRLVRIYGVDPKTLFDQLWHQIDEEMCLLAFNEEPFTNNQSSYV